MARITIEISDAAAERLRAAAARARVSEGALVEAALETDAAEAAAFRAAVEEGRRAVAAGDASGWDDMMEEVERIIGEAERGAR